MDELATAASVLAMSTGSDSIEEVELEGASGAPHLDVCQRSIFEPMPVDKENHSDLPADGEDGAAHRKVSTHTPPLCSHPCTPPFTCLWHPTT